MVDIWFTWEMSQCNEECLSSPLASCIHILIFFFYVGLFSEIILTRSFHFAGWSPLLLPGFMLLGSPWYDLRGWLGIKSQLSVPLSFTLYNSFSDFHMSRSQWCPKGKTKNVLIKFCSLNDCYMQGQDHAQNASFREFGMYFSNMIHISNMQPTMPKTVTFAFSLNLLNSDIWEVA